MYKTITDSSKLFTLEAADATPIYRQIIKQIEYAILAERLKPGDKLPTIRRLAVELKINPNTIVKAYKELEIRGILITHIGNGTYISDKNLPPQEDGQTKKIDKLCEQLCKRFLRDMEALGLSKDEILKKLIGLDDGIKIIKET